MTRPVDPVLPDELRTVLEGDDLEARVGFTLLLLTNRDDGWPHLTMLSVGEVIIVDEQRVRLAVWPTSSAASNLVSRRKATLATVLTPMSWLLRVSVRPLPSIVTALGGGLAAFEASIVEAVVDEAPYAVLESGVRFRLDDQRATLARWVEVRRALAEAAP